MKLLVFIDHFESGGAARVTSIMCKYLAQRGYDIVVAYNRQRKVNYDYGNILAIDTFVKREGTNHVAGILFQIKRILTYKNIIRDIQPNVIIGIEPEPYLHSRLASLCTKIPIIAVDHTSYRRKQHWFTHWIRWHAYRWATRVSILSNVDKAIIGNQLKNAVVIHNPLSFPLLTTNEPREKIILCVGRPDAWKVKGFDRMIRIWEKISPQHKDWQLIFAGVSCQQHDIAQVQFLGEVHDMQSLYRRAAIFALPSRIEGFSMSLLEAGSQGCACISFALGGVTEEIYTHEKCGIIIKDDDEQAFADALSNLIDHQELIEQYSNAIKKEMKRFSISTFIDTWERLCHDVCKE